SFACQPLDGHLFCLRLQGQQLFTSRLISSQHNHRDVEVTGNRSHLSDFPNWLPIEKDILDIEALGMRQNPVLGPSHGMLSDKQDSVIELVLKVIVGWGRPALD